MFAEILVIVALPLLLAAAAGWDLASFTIPNFLTAALLGAFALFALAAGLTLPAIGWHLLAGLLGLIGFTLFALGYIGGGDAKLFAASCCGWVSRICCPMRCWPACSAAPSPWA